MGVARKAITERHVIHHRSRPGECVPARPADAARNLRLGRVLKSGQRERRIKSRLTLFVCCALRERASEFYHGAAPTYALGLNSAANVDAAAVDRKRLRIASVARVEYHRVHNAFNGLFVFSDKSHDRSALHMRHLRPRDLSFYVPPQVDYYRQTASELLCEGA